MRYCPPFWPVQARPYPGPTSSPTTSAYLIRNSLSCAASACCTRATSVDALSMEGSPSALSLAPTPSTRRRRTEFGHAVDATADWDGTAAERPADDVAGSNV